MKLLCSEQCAPVSCKRGTPDQRIACLDDRIACRQRDHHCIGRYPVLLVVSAFVAILLAVITRTSVGLIAPGTVFLIMMYDLGRESSYMRDEAE